MLCKMRSVSHYLNSSFDDVKDTFVGLLFDVSRVASANVRRLTLGVDAMREAGWHARGGCGVLVSSEAGTRVRGHARGVYTDCVADRLTFAIHPVVSLVADARVGCNAFAAFATCALWLALRVQFGIPCNRE
jgi:hypothetical protein